MTAAADIPAAAPSLGRRKSQPEQRCDIVMKGGITSGIVYPKAVARLAEEYTFKNIGGTSAGAIAAVAAAAAEYGYQEGNTDAFTRLAQVPAELGARKSGKNSRLLLLFQPQPGTRWILAALLAFLRDPNRNVILKAMGALASVCAAFPLRTLAAVLIGIAAFAAPIAFGGWHVSFVVLGILGGALAFLVLFAALVLYKAVKTADRAIADNACGVCTGMEGALGDGETPLSVWMADIFDELGGHSSKHADAKKRGPVTFGDLWGTRDPKAERRLNLVTMTVNLNQGRPYSLPFGDADEKRYWFDRGELNRLFPTRIVDWLVDHPHPLLKKRAAQVRRSHPNLHPLPAPADLPIVVAARVSMSFPGLLSAIPLHEFRIREKAADGIPIFRKCWFSDGGMCSNLPVHLFDGVLPRWPTFAINLRYFKKDDPELEPRVSLPDSNSKGWEEFPYAFAPERPASFVLGLVNAIKNAMQNWVDNSQIRMPGYRDRVAHIHLDDREGGMNLNMDKELIDRIADYGRQAAERLIEHFAPRSKVRTNWNNHRWVRFRSGMAMLEEKLFMAARALEPNTEQRGFETYEQLIDRCSRKPDPGEPEPGAPGPAYRWPNLGTRASALDILVQLRSLIRAWRSEGEALRTKSRLRGHSGQIFLANAPRPEGSYRVMPRF